MKLISKLFLILIVCFLISCTKKPTIDPVNPIVIERTYLFEKCNRDVKPTYSTLDSSVHIGSAYNVNILLGNLNYMTDYIKSLENTVSCYELQIKETK